MLPEQGETFVVAKLLDVFTTVHVDRLNSLARSVPLFFPTNPNSGDDGAHIKIFD
jgi:hypothetical protein